MTFSLAPIYVPGDYVCPLCSYRYHARTINANDGSVGVKAEFVQTQCPNDGSEMQPLTWKQEAEEANAAALDLLKQLERCKQRLEQFEPVN